MSTIISTRDYPAFDQTSYPATVTMTTYGGFPQCVSAPYWTSASFNFNSSVNAYAVDFCTGQNSVGGPGAEYQVRCVRNGP